MHLFAYSDNQLEINVCGGFRRALHARPGAAADCDAINSQTRSRRSKLHVTHHKRTMNDSPTCAKSVPCVNPTLTSPRKEEVDSSILSDSTTKRKSRLFEGCFQKCRIDPNARSEEKRNPPRLRQHISSTCRSAFAAARYAPQLSLFGAP
jgi:hypothetical protein